MSLKVENLSAVSNGRIVFRDINLEVFAGRATAVLGANGAGKSELVLAMAGMLTVAEGSVDMDSHYLTNAVPNVIRSSGIAAVPEGHRVLTDLSVDENLRAAGTLRRSEIDKLLDINYRRFPELAAIKSQLAGTLSGGQQQMVAICHALMSKPKYILIDEMSLGLAPLIVERLMGVVDELKAEGVGVLLIEQFTHLALKHCETAIVMRNGRLTYSGDAQTLANNPNELDKAYFG